MSDSPAATRPVAASDIRRQRRELDGLRDGVRLRLFTELGSGALDLDGILRALARRDYTGWLMIEQDSSWLPPSEAAAIGRRVLARALRVVGAEPGRPEAGS